jgi:hypothetical protein
MDRGSSVKTNRTTLEIEKQLRHSVALIGVFAIEGPASTQGATQAANAIQSGTAAMISGDVERPIAGNTHLDVIALLERQRFDNCGGSRMARLLPQRVTCIGSSFG